MECMKAGNEEDGYLQVTSNNQSWNICLVPLSFPCHASHLSLSIPLSYSLFLYLSISLYPFVLFSLFLSLYPSALFFLFLYLSLSICSSLYLSLYPSALFFLFLYLSLSLCLILPMTLSFFFSVLFSLSSSLAHFLSLFPLYSLSVFHSLLPILYLSIHLSIYRSYISSAFSISYYIKRFMPFFPLFFCNRYPSFKFLFHCIPLLGLFYLARDKRHKIYNNSCLPGGGSEGGAVPQSVKRKTPSEEVLASIPAPSTRSLLVGSVSVIM